MWELLAYGSFLFWVVIGLEALLLMFLVNMEEMLGTATISVIISAVLLQVFGTPVLSYVVANPQTIAIWAAIYMAAGILWSVGKWWLYVSDQRYRYDEEKIKFLKYKDLPLDTKIAGNNELRKAWKSYLSSSIDVKPQVAAEENKARICGWIGYWPWSCAWTLINDPVKRAVRLAYKSISSAMQKISDHAFRGTEGEI